MTKLDAFIVRNHLFFWIIVGRKITVMPRPPPPCLIPITEWAAAYHSCSLHVWEDVSTISYSIFICTCGNACTDICRYNSNCRRVAVGCCVDRWRSYMQLRIQGNGSILIGSLCVCDGILFAITTRETSVCGMWKY